MYHRSMLATEIILESDSLMSKLRMSGSFTPKGILIQSFHWMMRMLHWRIPVRKRVREVVFLSLSRFLGSTHSKLCLEKCLDLPRNVHFVWMTAKSSASISSLFCSASVWILKQHPLESSKFMEWSTILRMP